jgi:hypothetical protein
MSSHDGGGNDHGVYPANTGRALAPWRHKAASHEATNMLHQAMYLAPYLPGGIVFAFTIDSVTCYYIVVVKLASNII